MALPRHSPAGMRSSPARCVGDAGALAIAHHRLEEAMIDRPMDRPNTFPWPPVLYGVAILCALALQQVFPLPYPLHGSGTAAALRLGGWALLMIGAGFDMSAMATMTKARANILPHRAATSLVVSGPFAISRNPIYLGNTTMMVGAGLAFGNLWLIATGLIAARLVLKLAIEREERHLEERFGPAWFDYSGRVRRWIGWR